MEAERPQRNIAGEQLIGVGGAGQEDGPEQGEPALRAAERYQAFVRPVNSLAQVIDARGHAGVPPLEPSGQPMHGVTQPYGEHHGDEHEHAEDAEDREAGTKQVVVRDAQHDVMLRQ